MSEAEGLKEEGNTHFRKGDYQAAITKYEAALALGADPKLYLILLTNRLHAHNNLDDNNLDDNNLDDNNLDDNYSIQAREDILEFLASKPFHEWKLLISDHMLCKALFQNYRSFRKQNNLERASTMLRGCLSFEPGNKTVLAAISELVILATQKIAEGGIIRAGTATSLSVVAHCVHCMEDIGLLEDCIQFSCDHSFHRDCAIKWWQHQAENNPPVQRAGISYGDLEKLTCPVYGFVFPRVLPSSPNGLIREPRPFSKGYPEEVKGCSFGILQGHPSAGPDLFPDEDERRV